MNIRWIWGNFIEPEWKLTHQQTREAHRLAQKRHMTQWRMLGYTAFILVLAYVAFGLLHEPVTSLLFAGQSRLVAWLLGAAILMIPLIIAGTWSYHFIYRRPLRRAMRDMGYDVCVGCGYWLRGLNDDITKCPECGMNREKMPEQSRIT